MDIIVDWKFWSLIVSAIAVTLSQLPPVLLWFRPRRLLVEVHSRILVAHKVGNPNVSLYLSVHNNGGKTLRIVGTSLSITRDGDKVSELPALNYFQDTTSKSTVLFVPYYLKPDDSWAHTTNFSKYFERNIEKDYRNHLSKLRSNISLKIADRPKSKESKMVEADKELVEPFEKLFNDLFVWEPGEYIIELKVETNSGSASFNKKYRFTIFESDTNELNSHTEDYKFGGGLAYDVDRHVSVTLPLTEHNG